MNTQATPAAVTPVALIAVPSDGVIEAVPERRAAPKEKGGRRTKDAVPVVLAQGDDAPMPKLTAKERKAAESQARVRADVARQLEEAARRSETKTAEATAPTPTPAPEPAPAAAKLLDDVRRDEVTTNAAPPIPDGGYQGPMRALRERLKAGRYTKMANGQPANGDEVATLLGSLEPSEVIQACMFAMALEANPYLHLNIGQQSMNLRNKLRGMLKRGEFGMGVLREAVEEVLEARPAPAAPAPAAETPPPAQEAAPIPESAPEEPKQTPLARARASRAARAAAKAK